MTAVTIIMGVATMEGIIMITATIIYLTITMVELDSDGFFVVTQRKEMGGNGGNGGAAGSPRMSEHVSWNGPPIRLVIMPHEHEAHANA